MIQIRLLQPGDRQGLIDLIEPVDKNIVGMYSETKELVDDWINTIEEGMWEVFVVIISQKAYKIEQKRIIRKLFPWKRLKDNPSGIIGLVTLYADWQEDDDLEQGEFDIGITVAEAFKRKGIGKELLLNIIKRGELLGYNKATLWTRIDNYPMIKLAENFGFKKGRTRTRHGHKWDQYYQEIDIIKKERKKDPTIL
ncbi:MAG: GNAT family N-acetyltransferase [Candidatus Heimdallarchaeota archaeon]|nr:GNAT family N-acetyltransferase [Candidatus Heimdallarchaeota archaeon]MBY8993253.1 GNAT family N-acetyltransferase [Candidatus Heimdallarchaeota archaeon]